MTWALLVGLIAAYAWYVRGGGVAKGTGRIERYRRWMRRAPLAFGLTSLIALLLGGRLSAFTLLPPEFAGMAEHAWYFAGFGGDAAALKAAVLGGLGGGALIGLALAWWRKRRGKRPLMTGNLGTILPTTRTETAGAALVGVMAGMVEELFFRLALPLFATFATGSAALGFALALLLFAYAHRYQGWVGITASVVAGGLLTILYLTTGELWFAMLVHALLNLNGLVLRPAVLGPQRG